MNEKKVLSGYAIVVVDRGFVYVGQADVADDWCVITNARGIRYWGTTKGLGELATGGPTAKTILDVCGTVRIPLKAVISMLDTEQSKWKAF